MRNFKRIIAVFNLTLIIALGASAQEGPTRADFDCLRLAMSSKEVPAGERSSADSFHHVWIPDLAYGHFESNGLRFIYEMEGAGRDVLIVVHGGPGLPHEYFHPMLSTLGRYMRVVYFDRRADMLSATSPSEVASPVELADDIDALRKRLGLRRVTLMAHSYAGTVALTYALRYPSHIKRLILVGASAAIESQTEVEKRLLKRLSPAESAAFYSSEGSAARVTSCERVRTKYRALYPHYFNRRPDAHMLERGVYSVYFDALARKQLLATDPGGFDLRSQLHSIKAPTLVVVGRHDEVTPPALATELANGLPRARLVVMEQSGHFPFFEESYLFNEWVRQFVIATGDLEDDWLTASPTSTATVLAPMTRQR